RSASFRSWPLTDCEYPAKCFTVAVTPRACADAGVCIPLMLAAPIAAERTGSSAQVSYVRPHRLSRDRSCTGAKSHTQPVALNAAAVLAPPACARTGSHVAPIPIDCGYKGAW